MVLEEKEVGRYALLADLYTSGYLKFIVFISKYVRLQYQTVNV